ncbi:MULTISPECIES: hypothetical protein [Nostoc]|uniref:Uncharacterized protein n=1 Tax=Nostoc punctiforme FACHB-252 TaxID=1357509 RepID=A0ABR8HL17_NOSPU|nr:MULTISPECIES: hypothetical protein [Nostoc]MBC1237337.1 hypothetical protein [Nostoc sp. 2RC]MBD2615951.1 hypothetical protein [Nostoc punctiforme FACHB-252]
MGKNAVINLKYLSVVASTYLIFSSSVSSAIALDTDAVPTIPYEQALRQGKIPDWSKITWEMLPALEQPGFLKVPKELVLKLGYDPSREWNAGQKSDSVVMLGDADDAFRFGDLTLEEIAKIALKSNAKDKDPTLLDVGFIQWQTTASLVKAIPTLGNLQVTQVKPILAVLGQSVSKSSSCRTGTIAQCLRSNPSAAQRTLGDIDLNKYSTKSIPDLEKTPIRQFKDWQRTYINQVPGLNQVPFDKMPNPITSGTSSVGIASVVFGKSERGDNRVGDNYFISGSVVRGDYTVTRACSGGKECAYLELGDFTPNGPLYGKRWASGSSQQVKGGYGFLAGVNGGKEPTGRLVYGNAFKVVMTGANESTGTADFGLFFRICMRPPFMQKTCTPYFIGPVPWMSVRENDLVIVGTGR